MTYVLRSLFTALVSLAIALPAGAEPAPRVYTQAELDQMLAPVALYPDPLLSQVLMAATYPLEVSEAARWSRANPGLQGDNAVRAVQGEDWDPSVKSLVAFPQILARMDENPAWTQALGDAFLAQEPQVMDEVQQLRRHAQAAGNLQSSDQLYVQQQGQTIVLQPANPQYVYVPYYDPMLVYGPWWWSAYPPVVWAPWPGYARVQRPGVSVGFWWGAPVGLSASFFFGNFDWRQRQVRVVNVNNYYYRPPQVVSRTVVVERNHWQHDPSHRRGVSYRVPEVRQRYAEFQPRSSTEIRREEQRRPEERHQVLSREKEPQVQRRQEPQVQRLAPQSQPRAQPQPQSQPREQAREQQIQRQAQRPAPQAQRPPAERRQRAEQRQERHEAREQAPQERQAERRGERGQKGGDRS